MQDFRELICYKEIKIKMTITSITNLSQAISNLKSGDCLFLDIDDTLLLLGIQKYIDDCIPTEPGLLQELQHLHERKIRLIALTARKHQYKTQTEAQLKKNGIILDDIIHAPNIRIHHQKCVQKGLAVVHYLTTLPIQPKRILVVDDKREQLEDIFSHTKSLDIPCVLLHYVRPQHQALLQQASALFPESLAGFTVQENLGGGTASTYHLYNAETKQSVVLKHGAHANAIKLEILCNLIYKTLGVPVPHVEAYNTLPSVIAKKLSLSHVHGIFQVSEYLTYPLLSAKEIKTITAQHFIAHVLIGNIDIAKPDNFIGTFLIDAGANFLFRAKGQRRQENPSIVEELNSLRDDRINQAAANWFADLSDEDITQQVKHCANNQSKIEALIWEASDKLEMSNELRNDFLQYFSDRLDTLITRYCPEEQMFTKSDKRARIGKTAAGVLTYKIENNKPYLLLAKRVRHDWWDNFGGKSDAIDTFLYETAIREVAEESHGILHYTSWDLLHHPSHDLISERDNDIYVYRMYLIPHSGEINLDHFQDKEHSDYAWVPVKNVLRALNRQKNLVDLPQSNRKLLLYPPLYTMLMQAEVKTHLQHLMLGKKLNNRHTQSQIKQQNLKPVRAFYSPVKAKQQLAETLFNHTKLIREIKRKNKIAETAEMALTGFSPSELHLQAMMGTAYQQNNLEANVRKFLREKCDWYRELNMNAKAEERFIGQCVQLIQIEKQSRNEYIYFYHACNSEIAFAYHVFTSLYQTLRIEDNWPIFRASKHHFERFPTIQEFIDYYSENGSKEINNDSEHFNDCVLAANIFLFGNHNTSTSCSPHYLLSNSTRRKVNLKALLLDILSPFSISSSALNQLLNVYEQEAKQVGGVLYQIGIPTQAIKDVAYPAGYLGVMKEYKQTRDFVAILSHLEKDLATKNNYDVIQYIKRVQARLFLPPSQLLKVSKATQFEAKTSDSSQKVLDSISHTLLQHMSKVNANLLDDKIPLLRLLQSVYDRHKVNVTNIHEISLAKAIQSRNLSLVNSILNANPEMLIVKLPILKAYIDYFDDDTDDKNGLTPIEMMLLQSYSPEEIHVCIGDNWWQKHSSILIPDGQLNEQLDLAWVVLCIPMTERATFVTQYQHLITNFGWILELLPEEIRVNFAYNYADKIIHCYDLIDVLAVLPKRKRIKFARSQQNKIKSGWELCHVLRELPEDEKYLFAMNQKSKISAGNEFCEVVKCLPSKDRLTFTNNNLIWIDDIGLHHILNYLPKEERLGVAIRFQEKINDFDALLEVLPTLEGQERYLFASLQANKIQSFLEFFKVLKNISAEDRFYFARDHQDKIIDGNMLIALLKYLKTEDCSYFAVSEYKKIGMGQELNAVLTYLNSKDKYQFAKENQQKITNGYDLSCIIAQLDWSERLPFAIANQAVIHDGHELGCILKHLKGNNRFTFALANQNVIELSQDLIFILMVGALSEHEKLLLLTNHQNKIESGYHLGLILGCLKVENRLNVAIENQAVINNTDELGCVLNYLNADDCFNFAMRCCGKVAVSNLSYIVNCLPECHRLAYVTEYQEKIVSVGLLIPILQILPSAERTNFACSFIGKIPMPHHRIKQILECLPVSENSFLQKLQFAAEKEVINKTYFDKGFFASFKKEKQKPEKPKHLYFKVS